MTQVVAFGNSAFSKFESLVLDTYDEVVVKSKKNYDVLAS